MAARATCLACLLLALFVPHARGEDAPRLRVLTYNIHHGEGTDGKLDLARIARVITDHKPDLVALQEVDVNTQRTGNVDQAAELAKLTGLHVVFGKSIDYRGGQYGNAVLSRFPVEKHAVHPLPGKPDAERRTALEVVVRPWEGGPPLTFVGTHLDHTRDETDRFRQAEEINRLLASDAQRDATILAGDLNAVPTSETIKKLAARWTDAAGERGAAPTVPAGNPRSRIDYVLLRPTGGWRVVEAAVPPEPVASDHRPVLAVLEWRGAKK
jgi:endonuclease/exonuclease/phosphatase family metal-dependent hydrolase